MTDVQRKVRIPHPRKQTLKMQADLYKWRDVIGRQPYLKLQRKPSSILGSDQSQGLESTGRKEGFKIARKQGRLRTQSTTSFYMKVKFKRAQALELDWGWTCLGRSLMGRRQQEKGNLHSSSWVRSVPFTLSRCTPEPLPFGLCVLHHQQVIKPWGFILLSTGK